MPCRNDEPDRCFFIAFERAVLLPVFLFRSSRDVYVGGLVLQGRANKGKEKKMKFEQSFLKENMMGPNVVTLTEELTAQLHLTPDMRIMDLGCGKGLSSMVLAQKSGAQVFAVDLWISATENYERFEKMGFGKSIIPIHADVMELPFAQGYFDAVVSVDAYHYFGRNDRFMDEKFAPYVKEGGIIALAFPGFKEDIHDNLPEVMLRSWSKEDLETFQSFAWWEALFQKSELIEVLTMREMSCHDACWADWLECDNEYAINDRIAMEAGAGEYMNFIAVICRRK
jgi:cyclopropane fatty-acyl-phospholipid synthase-like methyltransferase